MKVEKITIDLLKKLGACEEGIDFFKRNKLEGFPILLIPEINGDHDQFAAWVYEKFVFEYYKYDDTLEIKDKRDGKIGLYKYDINGNKIYQRDHNGREYTWEYEYDEKGNKIWMKDIYRNELVWKYKYDESGKLIWKKDYNEIECVYKYDNDQNLIFKEFSTGKWISYEYDNNILKCSRDSCGQIKRYDGNCIYFEYKNIKQYKHEYDDHNNIILEMYSNGGIVKHEVEYYDDGQLKRYDSLEIPWIDK